MTRARFFGGAGRPYHYNRFRCTAMFTPQVINLLQCGQLLFDTPFARSQKASQFCLENGIRSEAARQTLTSQMEEAISGNSSGSLHQAGRPPEAPESTDATLGSNQRLEAIINLQKARARALEESTTSFEQVLRYSRTKRSRACCSIDRLFVTLGGLFT